MKLNQKTVSLLKNFATINPSIVFEEGSRIRTISEIKNVLAEANILESIPKTFGIHELNQFLGVISMFDEPVLDIQDKYVNVSGEGSKQRFKFFFTDPSQLTKPAGDLSMPKEDITFDLCGADLAAIRKASQTLGTRDLVIEPGKEGWITLTITDLKDKTSNSSTLELNANYTKDDFKIILNTMGIKL